MDNQFEIEKKVVGKKVRTSKGPPAREALPSDQVSFEGQLKVLRAYANASAGGTKGVSLDRIASVTQLSKTTVSSCNAFFVASNFIGREKGGYMPTEGTLSFAKQFPWNEEKAKSSLREMMKDTWYTKELHVLFGINPSMNENEMVSAIGSAIGAREDKKVSLEILVKLLEYARMINEDPSTGKFTMAEKVTGEEEAIAIAREATKRTIKEVYEGEKVKVEGVEANFIVNLNITIDVTSGTAKENVRKIKDIMKELREKAEEEKL